MRVLITGGCGFIGHHLVEHLHRTTTWDIFVVDVLSYASQGLDRYRSNGLLHSPRLHIFCADLAHPLSSGVRRELGSIHIIIHLAAETHIDNSILDPVHCIRNNVMGTTHLLEYARTLDDLRKFFYFSTDEVYGSAPAGVFYAENDAHTPTNPYSASKSAGEQLCIAYANTYAVPIVISNCMNAIGERQHVEKFVPKVIRRILRGECIDVHADPTGTLPGSRCYIHARNVADAVRFLIDHAAIGERYNIVGERECDNLEMVHMIAHLMGDVPFTYQLVNYHADRPGHDLRYALCGAKLEALGWTPPKSLEDSLRRTVEWTLAHPEWLEDAASDNILTNLPDNAL